MEDPKWGWGTSKPRQGFQPDEKSINEGGNTEGAWGEGGFRYHNPDPLCRLIGPQNKVKVIVNDEQVTALVDSGAQISTVSMAFVEHHGLPIWQLQQLLDFEGFGGVEVPYIGYPQLQLKIPGVKDYDKDILVFIQKDSKYSEQVAIVLGTLHIKDVIQSATKEELVKFGDAWEMGTLGSFVSARIAQLNETPMINQVDHYVRLTRKITLPPMQVHKAVEVAKIPVLSKRLNVMTESLLAQEAIEGIEAVPSYETFKQGGNRVTIGLQNLTREKIILRKGTKITHVLAANIVPHMLAPDPSTDRSELENMLNGVDSGCVPEYKKSDSQKVKKPEPTPERLDSLFSKLDLSGIQEWSEDLQQRVHNLIVEYQHLFALHDLELGKMAKVKHEIRLSNPVPFKDRYRRIPPHEFEEVRNHLQDMLKVGAIRKSVSPWASPVVLVRKKDGSLRFCIDLRKLNSRTIKDAYSLLRIEESLDCLNGAIIFTSLDLKAGYWQVEMEESSIPYTAFTVGPLGFYECVRMPFGLTNTPATFQCLMESCLGDYHLKYCIIYLDDIIIFSKTPEEHIDRLGKVFQKLDEAGL